MNDEVELERSRVSCARHPSQRPAADAITLVVSRLRVYGWSTHPEWRERWRTGPVWLRQPCSWPVVSAGLRMPAAFAQTGAFVPVTQAMQANPDPGDWLHISRTYNQQRFSPLTQINKSNVAQLRMAWSRGLPAGVQESTPIVYRGVMYVMAPGASIAGARRDQRRSDLGVQARLRARRPDRGGAQQEPRHLPGHDLFRRA